MKEIDINCDMGESSANLKVGNDLEIFPYITSTNIACGKHAGDPFHIQQTIELALQYNVQIGAHPGYPDFEGFGRKVLKMTKHELSASIKYQVAALKGMVESAGGELKYVKPHGALYNEMAINENEAKTVIEAIRSIDDSLMIMGLAGSHVKELVENQGMTFIAEAFADRSYEANSQLRSRSKENAVLNNPSDAAEQAVSIVLNQHTKTLDGTVVPIQAESFCIHGDNPSAVEILKTIEAQFEAKGIVKKAFSKA
jgi:5-oxoprolinase (ATP-hydrolysing) subunit A